MPCVPSSRLLSIRWWCCPPFGPFCRFHTAVTQHCHRTRPLAPHHQGTASLVSAAPPSFLRARPSPSGSAWRSLPFQRPPLEANAAARCVGVALPSVWLGLELGGQVSATVRWIPPATRATRQPAARFERGWRGGAQPAVALIVSPAPRRCSLPGSGSGTGSSSRLCACASDPLGSGRGWLRCGPGRRRLCQHAEEQGKGW